MTLKTVTLVNLIIATIVHAYVEMEVPISKNVFDLDLYEEVLDPDLCREQIRVIANNSLLLYECKYENSKNWNKLINLFVHYYLSLISDLI